MVATTVGLHMERALRLPLSLFAAPADDAVGPRASMRRAVGAFSLLLLGATWKLWTPQQVYPQVPLLPIGHLVPVAAEWFALGCMVFGSAAMLVLPASPAGSTKACRRALAVFAGTLALLILIDQHRLQPWAYQFLLLSLVLALTGAQDSLALAVGIYFHSALSKLDATFTRTVGRELLSGLFEPLGIGIANWPAWLQIAGTLCMPIGELLLAIALCWHRTRLAALVLAVGMHLLLLVVLGAGSLDQQPGVLIWNLFFIVQALLLFGPRQWYGRSVVSTKGQAAPLPAIERHPAGSGPEEIAVPEQPARRPMRAAGAAASPGRSAVPAWTAQAIIYLAVLLPLLEPLGWFDHWLSWGLYAPRSSRVYVLLQRGAARQLPPPAQRHLAWDAADGSYVPLLIDRWSLAALGAPIYPQARFQLGVALAVAGQVELSRDAVAVHASAADRFSGARETQRLAGSIDMQQAGQVYVLGWQPRGRWGAQREQQP